MDNGASSYRRFREDGDESGLVEIIRDYKDGLILYLNSFVGNIHTAEEIAVQLIEYGYVRGRVDIGLSMIDITSIFDLMAYNLSSPGVYVYDSPYNDQIKSGDRIQAVNGVAVSSAAEVKAAYRDCEVGDVITVSVVRGRQVIDVQITLRELVPTSTGVEFGS